MATATSRHAAVRAVPTSPPNSAPTAAPTGHVAALDGVRGLAILLVLVFHLTMGMSSGDLASRRLLKLTGMGWCGVDLFFVLSGFLITGILCETRDDPHRVRNFYARRALRIFPLYYGTLLLSFAARAFVPSWVPRFAGVEEAGPWLVGYGTNVLAALRDDWFPLSHFWSLAVEEHFYLVWPAIVFGLSRRASIRVCWAIVLIALAARVALVRADAIIAAYCLTVCRSDALALGSLVALASRGPGGLESLVGLARRGLLLGGLALLALAAWRRGLNYVDPAVQTVGYLLLDLVFACGIILVLKSPPSSVLSRLLAGRVLGTPGRYSYGLYVFNSVALLVLDGLSIAPRTAAWSGSVPLARLVYVVLALASTLAATWLSWTIVERPFLRLKTYFPRGQAGSRPALERSRREPGRVGAVLSAAPGLSPGGRGPLVGDPSRT